MLQHCASPPIAASLYARTMPTSTWVRVSSRSST